MGIGHFRVIDLYLHSVMDVLNGCVLGEGSTQKTKMKCLNREK